MHADTDARLQPLTTWLQATLPEPLQQLQPITGAMSFRRYYRAVTANNHYVVMDAPPQQENIAAFVRVATLLAKANINVPTVFAQDSTQGFLLLEDFGDCQLWHRRQDTLQADKLYRSALDTLVALQLVNDKTLETYSAEKLRQELDFYQHWFLEQYLKLTLTTTQKTGLNHFFEQLVTKACEQPQVLVHRDFHSRNIMVLKTQHEIGLLDFQDAMLGPLTYDVVSLLRDCYVVWPESQVETWLNYYYQQAVQAGLWRHLSMAQCRQYFDWMGMQRHLKAIYRFAIKYCRDSDPRFLIDIAPAHQYVLNHCARYEALKPVTQFFYDTVNPRLSEVSKTCTP